MIATYVKYYKSNTDLRKYIGAFEISGNTWRVYHDAGHTDLNATSGAVTHRYYVRDFLGSTRAVIDEDGNVLQSTAYYPSGVPLTPNSLTPQTIKLHTGKDFFDLQGAGWYDNHARYYDCLIPTFKSQDPLAEKYPWLSPYNHCANNPLRFVDPDGQRISVIEKGIDYIYTYTDDGYGFYDAHGNPYSGNSEFVSKLTNALSEIQSVPEGLSVVSELMSSQHAFEIKEGANGFQATNNIKAMGNLDEYRQAIGYDYKSIGSGGIIKWDPDDKFGGIDQTGSGFRPAYVGLAHELFHGSDANMGLLYCFSEPHYFPKTNYTFDPNYLGVPKSEWRAIYRENIFRQQLQMRLRTHYNDKIVNGINVGIGPTLIDNMNNPINYP